MYLMLSMTIFPQIAILGALYTTISQVPPLRHARRADLQLPDLHAPVHDLGAHELHARAAGRPRGGGLRRRSDAAAGLLQGAAAADRARASSRPACSPSSRPGTSTSTRCRSSSRRTSTPCRSRSRPSSARPGARFAVPWGQIMAATVIVTLPLIVLVLVLQKRILAGLTGRRRQGLDGRFARLRVEEVEAARVDRRARRAGRSRCCVRGLTRAQRRVLLRRRRRRRRDGRPRPRRRRPRRRSRRRRLPRC